MARCSLCGSDQGIHACTARTKIKIHPAAGLDTRFAPLNYPGSKWSYFDQISPHLPYAERYVEPFGGGAAVLLKRTASPIEVYADINPHVSGFFRQVKHYAKAMQELLLSLPCNEQLWTTFKQGKHSYIQMEWQRAAIWFYVQRLSFGGMGRNYGRDPAREKTFRNRVAEFQLLAARLQNVNILTADYEQVLIDHDSHETVFYLDPPYDKPVAGAYKYEVIDHNKLLDLVDSLKAHVVISGFMSKAYSSRKWAEIIPWQRKDKLRFDPWSNDRLQGRGEVVNEYLFIKRRS